MVRVFVPEADLERVEDAHRRCVQAIAELDDDEIGRPSRLPGWTVGHVLTHLARNADSHLRRTEAARRGEIVDQYGAGSDGRAAEIEAGTGAECLRADHRRRGVGPRGRRGLARAADRRLARPVSRRLRTDALPLRAAVQAVAGGRGPFGRPRHRDHLCGLAGCLRPRMASPDTRALRQRTAWPRPFTLRRSCRRTRLAVRPSRTQRPSFTSAVGMTAKPGRVIPHLCSVRVRSHRPL